MTGTAQRWKKYAGTTTGQAVPYGNAVGAVAGRPCCRKRSAGSSSACQSYSGSVTRVRSMPYATRAVTGAAVGQPGRQSGNARG
jgi:hypothetical protein